MCILHHFTNVQNNISGFYVMVTNVMLMQPLYTVHYLQCKNKKGVKGNTASFKRIGCTTTVNK